MERTERYPKPGRGEQMWFRRSRDPRKRMATVVTFHEYSQHSPHITEKFTRMLADGTIPEEFQTKNFAQRVLPRRWDLGPRSTGGHRRAGIPTMGIWDREVPQDTQIGNAVPVKLALAIGRHFRRVLSV